MNSVVVSVALTVSSATLVCFFQFSICSSQQQSRTIARRELHNET